MGVAGASADFFSPYLEHHRDRHSQNHVRVSQSGSGGLVWFRLPTNAGLFCLPLGQGIQARQRQVDFLSAVAVFELGSLICGKQPQNILASLSRFVEDLELSAL
jgi:hypothetical protein